MRVHGAQLSETQLIQCLEVIKIFCREFDRISLNASLEYEKTRPSKFQSLRDSLELINLQL